MTKARTRSVTGKRKATFGWQNCGMNENLFDPMLNEIQAAVDAGAWQVALLSALTIPDVCSSMQSQNGRTTGSKYRAWVETWMGADYPLLDAEDLWHMRCSMLHQGQSKSKKYERIIFANAGSNILHNNIMDRALNLHLPYFIKDIIQAARDWENAKRGTPAFEQNSSSLIRWHSNGLEPYIIGVPVLG